MSLLTRLDIYLIQRRAARKVRAIADEKAARAHLNRPHVQSAHMIGFYTPPKAPTARDYGVTPLYVAFLLIVAVLVALLNQDDDYKAATVCGQIASVK